MDLAERVLGEDGLGASERLVHRRSRRHPTLDNIGMRDTPQLLGAYLAPGGVIAVETGYRRTQNSLTNIWCEMRILVV